MTLTPREYLHQHFGPKDRKWIESLSEERCFEVLEDVYGLANGRKYVIDREMLTRDEMLHRFEDLHPLPDFPFTKIPCLHCGEWDTHKLLCCSAGMRLPIEIPGEYENWR